MGKITHLISLVGFLILASCVQVNTDNTELRKEIEDNSAILYTKTIDGHQFNTLSISNSANPIQIQFNSLPQNSIVMMPRWFPVINKLIFTVIIGNDSEIFSSNIDGSELLNLTDSPNTYDTDFTLSPDGKNMVFVRGINGQSLYIMDLKNRNINPLLDEQVQGKSPIWSPTGNFIYFISDSTGSPNIFSIKPDGSDMRNISNGRGLDSSITIDKTGDLLSFLSDREGNMNVFTLLLSNEQIINRTPDKQNCVNPIISPNGRFIIFRSTQDGDDLFLMNLNTKSIENISQTPGISETTYSWSSTSEEILYKAMSGGVSEYYVYRLVDGNKHKLINLSGAIVANWLIP